jgi:NAD-dependent SIR2 family protein deacetylase
MNDGMSQSVTRAAQAIAGADALLVCAGAGMGVDSGLPDFRGPEGFWRAYPAARALGLRFEQLADPRWFHEDPPLAWGFYGHRLNLYRATVPHEGFQILRRWAADMSGGGFVFTSNVDGQFQRAGFPEDHVLEYHGSIHRLQCLGGCGAGCWPADDARVEVDEASLRAAQPLPSCTSCGGLARPNILMFGDVSWDSEVAAQQEQRFGAWLDDMQRQGARVAVVCLGAGKAIPTVRFAAERTARRFRGTLIRINPRDPDVPEGHVSLQAGALAGLTAIDRALAEARSG